MSTSHTSSKAAGCGCGSGGTAGTVLASPCSCSGAGCASYATEGYVRPRFFAGQLLTEDGVVQTRVTLRDVASAVERYCCPII